MIALRANDDHFVDRDIEVKTLLSWRRFLDVVPNPVDDVPGSIGIAHDAGERFSDLAQIWRLHFQEVQGCTGIVACGSDRLLDFVSDRSGELT